MPLENYVLVSRNDVADTGVYLMREMREVNTKIIKNGELEENVKSCKKFMQNRNKTPKLHKLFIAHKIKCARIGKHCVINTGAIIDHECVIGDFVNICTHTTLCGNVHVGNDSQVCAGSIVIHGVSIGDNTTVGAGSLMLKDVPAIRTP